MADSPFDLNSRSLDVFREVIETFIETGEPVGSRTLSRRLTQPLSPATIRNVMADLEEAGLLYAPHTSAGRLPTQQGLRFFVDGLLQVGDINLNEKDQIERLCQTHSVDPSKILEEASAILSGLSACAGLVMAPKVDTALKHIEFLNLNGGRILTILVSMDGSIENRILELREPISQDTLNDAAHFISSRIYGRTLSEAKIIIEKELSEKDQKLDELSSKLIEMGLGVWAGGEKSSGSLIVKGQSNLLDSITQIHELDQIRSLFQVLDTKETMMQLLNASIQAEGVQIFIGSENSSFQITGCSMIVAPYRNTDQKIIGAIGVIGPSRMNYSRIIPLVDYTAQIMGKILGK